MAVEYYVVDKATGERVRTCETSEQAVRDAAVLMDRDKAEKKDVRDLGVFYSADALEEYQQRQSAVR